jgi:hypothetical protein
MAKLLRAEVELTTTVGTNVRFGKELLKNAKALLIAEEAVAKRKAAAEAEQMKNQMWIWQQQQKINEQRLRDQQRYYDERTRLEAQAARDEEKRAKEKWSRIQGGMKTAGKVGSSVLDAVTFGNGAAVARGTANSAIRGGLAAATVGAGAMQVGADSVLRSIPGGNMLANIGGSMGKGVAAMTGPLGVVGEALHNMLATLGHLPQALQLAAIAAFAFAPAVGGIGAQVVKGLPAIGQLGKALLNLTGISERAQPVLSSLKRTLNTAVSDNALTSGLYGLGKNEMKLPPNAGAFYERGGGGTAFGNNLQAALLPKIFDQMSKSLQSMYDAQMRVVSAEKSWVAFLKEGAEIQKEITKQANMDAAANQIGGKRFAVRSTNARTQFNSGTADENAASVADMRAKNEVIKAKIGNPYAYTREAFPGGNTMAAQSQYRELLNLRGAIAAAVEREGRGHIALKAAAAYGVTNAQQRLKLQNDINSSDERSIKIIRERNAALLEGYRAEQRVANGQLDRASRLASLRNKKKKGEELATRSESIALGVGFPLLFGGGAGSVGGSLAGSFVGTGFGGQILGGAIGQAIDQFAQAAQTMAASLRDPIEGFEALKTAGLFASVAQERLIGRLIEMGRVSEAAAMIQAEVVKKIGNTGVSDMARLDESTLLMSRAWGELTLQMQAFIAGPLAEMLAGMAEALGYGNAATRTKVLVEDLRKGGKGKQADALLREAQKTQEARDTAALDAINKRYEPLRPKVPVKLTPDNQLKDATGKLDVAEKAEALRRQGVQLERSQQDARLQLEDQVLGLRRRAQDMERANIDLRRSVEDEIYRKRQEVARTESDNMRQRAQLAINRVDLGLSKLQVSSNEPGTDIANGLLAATQQYVKTRAEADADLQQKQRAFTIEMEDLKRASEKFRFDVARKVMDLQRQAVDYSRDLERAKITAERTIYDLQISAADYSLAKTKERIALEADPAKAAKQTTELTKSVGMVPESVLTHWLKTQGFGFTTGNFTDKGHATRRHTVNAKDMGILGGSDADALRRTSAMEKRLRATGAFPDRADGVLRGPISDPYGHGAGKGGRNIHLHLPTPGGMVRMTPELRQLIGGNTGAATGSATPRSVDTSAAMSGLNSLKAPGAAGVGDLVASMTALDGKLVAAKAHALELAAAFSQLTKEQAAEQMEKATSAAILQLNAPLDQLLKQQKDQAAYKREYADLIKQGVLPDLAEELVKIQDQTTEQLRQLDVTLALQEAVKLKLEGEGKWTAELQSQLDLLKAQKGVIEGKGIDAAGNAMDAASPRNRLQNKADEVAGQLNTLQDPVNQIINLSEALGKSFDDTFNAITTGTISARDAFAQLTQSMAANFMKMATDMITKWIQMKILGLAANFFGNSPVGDSLANVNYSNSFANLGMRAAGGPVTGSTPYIVGEKGPELFVPSSSGHIVPNHQMGAGSTNKIVINVDAKGTRIEGDETQSKQLARAVTAAVQAEMIKQQRPGGLLSGRR